MIVCVSFSVAFVNTILKTGAESVPAARADLPNAAFIKNVSKVISKNVWGYFFVFCSLL